MRIAKVALSDQSVASAILDDQQALLLRQTPQCRTLADLLHSDNPRALAQSLADRAVPLSEVTLLAPVDQQELWAAGVTYKRSQVARMEESETGASHYDRVYTAARPEIFFKSTPHRTVGPGQSVRIRRDTQWSVPEPEFTLVLSPSLKIVGYTIGNDMSARDIEGENPLYLPQAKLYDACFAVGPAVLLADEPLNRAEARISLSIRRGGNEVFSGETNLDQMARSFEDLVSWLGRDNSFPNGALLLTGTGVVPPNEFTLAQGDLVSITIANIGTLTNPVVQG